MKKIVLLTLTAWALLSCGNQSSTPKSTPMENAINNLMTRVSVRDFTGEKISDQQIETLLRAAMAAPSAMNSQPWTFLVITEDSLLAQLGEAFPYSRCGNHPACAIIPCGDMSKTLQGEAQDFWINDVSAATENLLLAAHAMGLGAVWTGLHPSEERYLQAQTLLGLPETIIPLCIVPVGVPAEQPKVKDKFNPDNIHYNRW